MKNYYREAFRAKRILTLLVAHLPDGEDGPHGGPAENVAHVHDGDSQDLSLIKPSVPHSL